MPAAFFVFKKQKVVSKFTNQQLVQKQIIILLVAALAGPAISSEFKDFSRIMRRVLLPARICLQLTKLRLIFAPKRRPPTFKQPA